MTDLPKEICQEVCLREQTCGYDSLVQKSADDSLLALYVQLEGSSTGRLMSVTGRVYHTAYCLMDVLAEVRAGHKLAAGVTDYQTGHHLVNPNAFQAGQVG